MRSPFHIARALFLLLAPVVMLGCVSSQPTTFYSDAQLDRMTREYDEWCALPSDGSLTISILTYGHPWSPRAIRITLTEHPRHEDQELRAPAHAQGVISWRESEYDERTGVYATHESFRPLSTEEINQFEAVLDRSELGSLPEEKGPSIADGSSAFQIRMYALDPIKVVARVIQKDSIRIIRRDSPGSLAVDALVSSVTSMADAKKAQPGATDNPDDAQR